AGKPLPVVQMDRGREGERGRGTQRESHTQCVSPRGEKEWQRDTKRSRTQCVSTTGPRERVGEKERVGEVERDTKRKPYSVCVSRSRGRQEGTRDRLKSALKSDRKRRR